MSSLFFNHVKSIFHAHILILSYYPAGPNPFMRYIGFAELAANAWSAVAMESILRVVAIAPEQLSKHYSLKMDWIKV